MAEITAALVKDLRARTGEGMMDCKKALLEANGDIEKAIDIMRKAGKAKAVKKANNVASEGSILTKIANNNYGVILEVNSQTDFVARDENFHALANAAITAAVDEKITDFDTLKAKFEEQRIALVAKIGENVTMRRMAVLEGENVGSYVHNARIGVLVAMQNADAQLTKHIAMHIAASKPQYLSPDQVPADVLAREKQVQIELAMESGKPREIAEKMISGRLNKFTSEISLLGQEFIMDPSKSVGQFLKEKNATVLNFIRFEVGEGIEKAEADFAAEVAEMAK